MNRNIFLEEKKKEMFCFFFSFSQVLPPILLSITVVISFFLMY